MIARVFARRRLATAALFVVASAIACHDSPIGPQSGAQQKHVGRVAVFSRLAGTSVNALVIDVSGPGIVKSDGATPDTLAFNIDIVNGVASGSIDIPAGPSRVITAHAFDDVMETHRGSVTVDIAEGTNPTVTITLIPLAASVPITVSVGTTIVAVFPGIATLAVGDTLTLTAEVHDQNGNAVQAGVRWATLNPVRATIDDHGVVTMRDTGSVQIVATYGTVGGSATLTGTTALSVLSYQVTWNGSVSNDWGNATNWTPHGIGAQRVPTLADSVVIPAGTPHSPRIVLNSTATNYPVKDLLIEAGGGLGSTYGYGVDVYGSAVIRGSDTASIVARPGAKLSGGFANLYIYGDTVRLADSVHAAYVELNNQATAGLILDGHRLTIDGGLTLYQGTITLADPDTLIVNGDVYWNGASNAGKLTGGVVLFRGSTFNGSKYHADGKNHLIFDRAAAGKQQATGFDFNNTTGNGGVLSRWEIRNRDGVDVCAQLAVNDTLSFVSTGTPAVMTSTCGGYAIKAYGPVTTSVNTSVGNYQIQLFHPSGTSLIGGSWSPSYTDFVSDHAPVKPDLNYQNLRFYSANALIGSTRATGQVLVNGANVDLTLAGHTLTAGDFFQVEAGSTLTMQNSLDSLLVSNYVYFPDGNVRDVEKSKITAGVLRVGGYLYGAGFNASGTHLAQFTASAAGNHYIDGVNSASYDQGFQNLEILSTAVYGLCSSPRVRGTLTVRANASLGSYCGNPSIRVDGDVVTEATSTFNPYLVSLMNATGTSNVAGTWAPAYTEFRAQDAPVKPTLAYVNVNFFASNHLLGPTVATGTVHVDGSTVTLDIGGTSLGVGGELQIANSSTLKMTHATDSVEVASDVQIYDNTSATHNGTLTAGVLRIGSYLEAAGFSASGTHRVVFTGLAGNRYINSLSYTSRPTQGFQDVEFLTGTTYGMCSTVLVKGTAKVEGTAVINNYCGNPTIRFDGNLVADASSTIAPYSVVLNNTQGTTNVSGAFTPTWTTVQSTPTGGALKPGLGYTNIAIQAPLALSANMTVNGDLQLNGAAANLTLSGHTLHVNGTFDLNTNGVITMVNTLDSLVVDGPQYWDGGTSESGKLTAGVNLAHGPTFCATNYVASGTHTTVFDASNAPLHVQCVGGGTPAQLFNDVVAQNAGVSLECNLYASGNVTVRPGSRIETAPNCGTGLLTVTKVLTDSAGATVTNGTGYPNTNGTSVALLDPSGTQNVFGDYQPDRTYFTALNAYIRPSKGNTNIHYRYVQIQQPADVQDSTEFDGSVDLVNSARLSLRGHTLVVRYGLNFDNTATLRMTDPRDTLVVGIADPTADFFWDGGANDNDGTAALLSDGAIKYYGDRFYAPQYKALAGSPHRMMFVGNASTGVVSIEATPTFAQLQVNTSREVRFSSNATVSDTLYLSSPTLLSGAVTVAVNGGLQTVSGSDVTLSGINLAGRSGTRDVLGRFRPAYTQFNATTPLTGAIKPGLEYAKVEMKGAYQLTGATTIAGDLDVDGVGSQLVLGGDTLTTAGYVHLSASGVLQMTNASDVLNVGGDFAVYGGAGISTLTNGVLNVAGTYDIEQNGNNSSNQHKVVFNGTGGPTLIQQVYAGGTAGLQDFATVEVTGTKSVSFNRPANINGSFTISSAAPVTSNSAWTFGSTVTVGAGGSLAVPSGSRFGTGPLSVAGTVTFAHGATSAGDLVVQSGGTATASGTGGTDVIDFQKITVNSGGTLNSTTPAGFRYVSGYTNSGTVNGQVVVHP